MVLMRARVNNDAVLQPLSATSQRAESRSHRRRGWNARNVDDFNCDPLPVSSLRIFLIFHDPPNLAASFFFFLILSVSLFLEREVANSVASQRERLFSRFSIRDSSHFFGGFWRLTPSNLSFREF